MIRQEVVDERALDGGDDGVLDVVKLLAIIQNKSPMSALNNVLSHNINIEKLNLQEKENEVPKKIVYGENMEHNVSQMVRQGVFKEYKNREKMKETRQFTTYQGESKESC